MSINYGSLPFEEQITFWQGKDLVATQAWDDLKRAEHDISFMVAGATKADLLADLHAAVDKAITQGTTLAQFRKDFDALVAKNGWTGWTGEGSEAGRAWRTKVIYETNLHSSYQAGRWAQIQEVKNRRPYLIYRHSHAVVSARPLHVSWDGLIVPVDSDWVKTHYPPNGWGCKCRMFTLSEKDLKKYGKSKPDIPPDDGIDPKTGMPNGIDKFWDYTPGASRVDFIREQMLRKAEGLPKEIGGQLEKLVMKLDSLPAINQVALDYVLEKGRKAEKTKTEFAYLYDAQGNKIFDKKGKFKNVGFTYEECQLMKDATLVHNHPSGSSLSLGDLTLQHQWQLTEIVAAGHNNVVYRASVIDGKRLTQELYYKIVNSVDAEIIPLVKSKELSLSESNLLRWHVQNLILDKAGLIKYTVENVDVLPSTAKFSSFIDKQAANLLNNKG